MTICVNDDDDGDEDYLFLQYILWCCQCLKYVASIVGWGWWKMNRKIFGTNRSWPLQGTSSSFAWMGWREPQNAWQANQCMVWEPTWTPCKYV